MDAWKEIEAERRELADLLESLTPEQWEAQTLCTEWKVRHLVAHLTPSNIRIGPFLPALIASGFNFNKTIAKFAIRDGQADTEKLLDGFVQGITSRKTPPGAKPEIVLCDVFLHHQDIRRPLGMPRDVPADRAVAVADKMKTQSIALGNKKRIAGLKLSATDTDWTHGDGPEVTGPIEALTLAMCGRTAAIDDLSGEGVETLRSRG
ncbi:MAG: maleylpyruvate isomerase family mycothiol-dependent enzyme [Actinobacteria bacterium]|nr:maleylpyruvate isomerase family mycothiol-dependent enzyme [Actinomycetota bacterium]